MGNDAISTFEPQEVSRERGPLVSNRAEISSKLPPSDPRLVQKLLAEAKDQLAESAKIIQQYSIDNQPESTKRAKFSGPLEHTTGQSTLAVDHALTFDHFFPNLNPEAKEKLSELDFCERALLCSSTIERNELYQETLTRFQVYEANMIKEEIDKEKCLMSVDVGQMVRRITARSLHDEEFLKLQAQLLQMRIQRSRMEAIIRSSQMRKGPAAQHNQTITQASTPAASAHCIPQLPTFASSDLLYQPSSSYLFQSSASERHQSDRHQSDRHQSDRHQSDRHQSDRHQSDRYQPDRHQSGRHQYTAGGRPEPSNCDLRR
ncbi:hypothetical protein PGT21_019836 [Puccinia graminis f. sp. tritici]|uniref:Uncharacterized protein n=1 Tax=Puccinia graminis f. sp. tritici TaxID=56615 RepID=A0A5B0NEE3_PUCGR|nr:hypothetical protein PGT21_019836 [Puccinia graminis f. sp. tritici]